MTPNPADRPLLCLNGEFLPETAACIPATDRAFLYGDGVFETLRFYQGIPFAWSAHFERLSSGARTLGLPAPDGRRLLAWFGELLERNQLSDAIGRIQVSRGSGARGYSPADAGPPLYLLTVHPVATLPTDLAPPVSLITSTWRVPADQRLAGCKTTSRLLQVLATAEARAAGADEALLLNDQLQVAEAASANFFWIHQNLLLTPPLSSGALPGVTRAVVRKLAAALGIETSEQDLPAAALRQVKSAFLTSSIQELRPVRQIDGWRLVHHPLFNHLQRAYRQRVERERQTRSRRPSQSPPVRRKNQ